jgi:exosome complex RNA-binding protein Rrp42 (RNase PH superfamily)
MEAFATLYNAEYYQRFLNHDVRPDGRSLSSSRSLQITSG